MRRYLVTGGIAAIVIAVFAVVLPRIANYGEVWEALRQMSPTSLAWLIGAAVLNLLTFPPPWMAAVPGLSFRRAMVMTQAATAASTVLPGGDVVGMGTQFAMLKSWDVPAQSATLGVVVTGAWNQMVNVAFPVAAVVLLAFQGGAPHQLVVAAVIGSLILAAMIGAFVALLARERNAWWMGATAGRAVAWITALVRRPRQPHWGDDVVSFRTHTLALVRKRWPHLTITTIAGHITVYLVLLAAVRAVGVDGSDVTAIEVFAAWSFIRIISAIPITPGGLGVVELGLTGIMVAMGGQRAPVVAATLVYRALTMIPPIALGGICLAWWRQRHAGASPA